MSMIPAIIANQKPLTKLALEITKSELTNASDGAEFCQMAIFGYGKRLIDELGKRILRFNDEINFVKSPAPLDALFRCSNSEKCRAKLAELNEAARGVIDFIKEVEKATGREAKA